MKINFPQSQLENSYDELSPGDVFSHEGSYFIKLKAGPQTKASYPALNLENFSVYGFSPDEEVLFVESTLTLGR